jgi:DNA-3-methyladenine glycosylase
MPPIDPARRFASRDTPAHARALLGMWLCGGVGGPRRITETEAYDGLADRACHASRGRTPRTAVMFGPAGVWYVYLCYGIHEMLNLVTGPVDYPAAVLIRGLTGTRGPGRATRALGIGRAYHGKPAAPHTGLWLQAETTPPAAEISVGPRVGIAYAGEPWVSRPWRFTRSPAAGSA